MRSCIHYIIVLLIFCGYEMLLLSCDNRKLNKYRHEEIKKKERNYKQMASFDCPGIKGKYVSIILPENMIINDKYEMSIDESLLNLNYMSSLLNNIKRNQEKEIENNELTLNEIKKINYVKRETYMVQYVYTCRAIDIGISINLNQIVLLNNDLFIIYDEWWVNEEESGCSIHKMQIVCKYCRSPK